MYFKYSLCNNNGKLDAYCRLIGSCRNEAGRVCDCTILTLGFMPQDYTPGQLNKVARLPTGRYRPKQSLFTDRTKRKLILQRFYGKG